MGLSRCWPHPMTPNFVQSSEEILTGKMGALAPASRYSAKNSVGDREDELLLR